MDISQAMQEITIGELSHWKDPKEIAKMEKVGSTEEKLPLKPYTHSAELRRKFTPAELRRMFTPDEIYQMFTTAELWQMFTPYELKEMLTEDQMSQMRVPKPRKPRLTQAQTEAFLKDREAFYKDRDGKRYSEVKYCGALEKGKKIIC